MQRTNIYLDDQQISALRQLADQRQQPVALLVRQAINAWLHAQGVQVMTEDEWQRRFAGLLGHRQATARLSRFDADQVAQHVAAAVREVRSTRSARRR